MRVFIDTLLSSSPQWCAVGRCLHDSEAAYGEHPMKRFMMFTSHALTPRMHRQIAVMIMKDV